MIFAALLAGIAAIGALATAAALQLRRRYVSVTVVGRSMEPAYFHGDRVLVRRVRGRHLRVGDIVVAEKPHPEGGWRTGPLGAAPDDRAWMIKRVAAVPGDPVPAELALAGTDGGYVTVPDSTVVVLGDALDRSTDSRQLGYFPFSRILGRVAREPRPARSQA